MSENETEGRNLKKCEACRGVGGNIGGVCMTCGGSGLDTTEGPAHIPPLPWTPAGIEEHPRFSDEMISNLEQGDIKTLQQVAAAQID